MSQITVVEGNFARLGFRVEGVALPIDCGRNAWARPSYASQIGEQTSYYSMSFMGVCRGDPEPGQTYFIGSRNHNVCRSFGAAIFVGTDGTVPLNDLVLACIKSAHDHGLTSLAMPDFCRDPERREVDAERMLQFVQGFSGANAQGLLIPRIFVAIGTRTTGYATSLEQELLRI